MRFRGGVRQPIDFCVNRTSPSNVVISQGSPEEKRPVHKIAQGEGHFDRYRCCCRVTGTWQISFAKATCSCDVTNFRLTDIAECDLYMTRDFVQRRVRTEVATRDKNDCATGHRTEAGWRNVINVRLLVKHDAECSLHSYFCRQWFYLVIRGNQQMTSAATSHVGFAVQQLPLIWSHLHSVRLPSAGHQCHFGKGTDRCRHSPCQGLSLPRSIRTLCARRNVFAVM